MHWLDTLAGGAHLPVLLLLLVLTGVGLPLPEDILLLVAGALASRGNPGALVSLPLCYLAVLAGDSLLFWVARRVGPGLLARRPLRWVVTPARRARVRELLARHGAKAVFLGRHAAGLRALVFATAAIEGVRFRTFLLFDALAALLTVPAVFLVGYFFADHLARVEHGIARTEHWVAAAVLLVVLVAYLIYRRRRTTTA